MMHNKGAFTLLEVLMALGIVIMAVSIIANLQIRSLDRMLRDRDDLEKIFLLKRTVYESFLNPPQDQKKGTTKLEDPEVTLTTLVENVSSKSSLAPLKDRLRIVRTRAEWKLMKDKREASMITFVPKPPAEKKENKT